MHLYGIKFDGRWLKLQDFWAQEEGPGLLIVSDDRDYLGGILAEQNSLIGGFESATVEAISQ